jgi:hypothetical protein
MELTYYEDIYKTQTSTSKEIQTETQMQHIIVE